MPTRRGAAAGLAVLACAVAACAVFSGALAYPFSQDDWSHLARARGLVPPLPGPWRSLSLAAFFEIVRAPFGLHPLPYHVVSLAAHAACGVLLYLFLRRRLAPASACLASVFFVAHPALFTVPYWISAIGDALSLGFALAALLLWESRARWRALAVPLFALSLLCKESTLLFPVVLLAARASDAADTRSPLRDPVWWACFALSIAAGIDLVVGRAAETAEAGSALPYAFGVGGHLWRNALTYLGWALNFTYPTVPGYSDAVDPRYYAWGAAALALWIAGIFLMPGRRRAWIAAAVVWLAWIGPVLALRRHTLHYYEYAAMTAVAWMVGIAFDAALTTRRRRESGKRRAAPPRTSLREEARPVLAAVLGALLVVNGRAVVKRIENAPLGHYGLRANSTVNRALVGQRIHDAIAKAELPAHTNLYFWSPARHFVPVDTTLAETYWERNARAATQDGLSVRLLFPQIDSVTFLRHPRPIPERDRYVVYGVDGSSAIATWGRVDSVNARLPVAPPAPAGAPEQHE